MGLKFYILFSHRLNYYKNNIYFVTGRDPNDIHMWPYVHWVSDDFISAQMKPLKVRRVL